MPLSDTIRQFNSDTALIFSGILVTTLVGVLAAYSVFDTPVFVYTAALAAAQLILFCVSMNMERRRDMLVLLWLQAICIITLLFLVPSAFVVVLTVVWLVQAVELYGVGRTVLFIPASLGLFVLAQFTHFGLDDWFDILINLFMYGLFQVFAVSILQRSVRERERREQMASLNRELIATRELLSQSAAQNERLRIARDLHDILGHHMTALILNLEVASHSVDGKPKEKVEQSLALAKLLLGDLRSTVSELREDSTVNLEQSIKKLVADIPGFAIEVDFSEAPEITNVEVAETFLRCTQEAVTNVLKHSSADQCRITLNGNTEQCTLSVTDNGKVNGEIEPGNGLKGMQERVQSRGGDLSWQQDDTGFQLHITLNPQVAT